jgi:hypothetical protein
MEENAMASTNRRPTDGPTKEPAEGSRRTVDEALEGSKGKKPGKKRGEEKLQTDVPPGRHALDD